jgi:hypothetical protein
MGFHTFPYKPLNIMNDTPIIMSMKQRSFTLDPRSDKLIMSYPKGLRSMVVRAAIVQFSLTESSRHYSSREREPA